MSVIFVCDGCNRQEEGDKRPHGWFKPLQWFSRRDDDGEQHACCRACIEQVAKTSGKTKVVLPF